MNNVPMSREAWDDLWAGDRILTRQGVYFEVATVESGSYPRNEEGVSPRRVYRIENKLHQSMQWGHYLLEGATVVKAASDGDAMTTFANPFYEAKATVLDNVEVLGVEGSLDDTEYGLEVESFDMPSGHRLVLTIVKDRALPEPVKASWLTQGNDVHLVTGVEGHREGWPIGAVIPAHLKRLYQNVYPHSHVKVELAFEAGPDYMAYYRVWLSSLDEYERRRAWIDSLKDINKYAPVTKRKDDNV